MVPDESQQKIPQRVGETKDQFWRKQVALFEASGLTQAEFCRRQGLSAGQFSTHKTEIRRRDAELEGLKKKVSKDEVYWRELLAKFKKSGISKDEFCASEGVKPAAFSWWRAEIGRRDIAKISGVATPDAASPRVFVELDTPKASAPALPDRKEKPIAEIDLHRGTVRLFENVTADSLAALFTALKEHLK